MRLAWRNSDIRTRTLAISLGPALLLTLLLTLYFTVTRLHELDQELTQTGKLIANQLAPAVEYGVISGNTAILNSLLQASLKTPHVRFIEVRSRENEVLAYREQAQGIGNPHIETFEAPIVRQQVPLEDPFLPVPSARSEPLHEPLLGRVVVGMTDEAFRERQQQLLLNAAGIALAALTITLLLAYRLASSLIRPIRAMGHAVEAIEGGDYHTRLPETDSSEIGDLARHINHLASALSQAQLDQRRSIAQLTVARETAEQASRAKSDFLAMMSHELRTPMNGVLGMLQLLETTGMTAEQREYTVLATESTEHLLKVINDILDFSRIERGALQLERIPFRPLELIHSSVQIFQLSARQRGLDLTLDLQAGLENFEVEGDPTRIRQILVNLVGNALKFTQHGEIRLETHWQMQGERHLHLCCAVHDTGIGIPPDRLEHMFDAFQQADNSISRRYGGTGLGLTIAASLARRMAGTLRAHSVPGQGSTFTFEIVLPLSGNPTGRALLPAGRPGATRGVLLLEEDPVQRDVLSAMLHSIGYRVDTAGTLEELLDILQHGPALAVLMHIDRLQADLADTVRRLRAGGGEAIPLIGMVDTSGGQQAGCLAAGLDDCLPRPCARSDLRTRLARWVSP